MELIIFDQQMYNNIIKEFDDPTISVNNQRSFREYNIQQGRRLITFTYSDRFGKDDGRTGICRLYGPEPIWHEKMWQLINGAPDLFRLHRLEFMDKTRQECDEYISLIREIRSGLWEHFFGLSNVIANIIAQYAREPMFEIRLCIDGREYHVRTVYELPFMDFPKAPMWVNCIHEQVWFRLKWFIEPIELIVTSKVGILRDYDSNNQYIIMSDWNLRKKVPELPELIDSDHPIYEISNV